jgi:WD repeat-containing protein 19
LSWDNVTLTTHVLQTHSLKGPQCITVGTTRLPYSLKPILFYEGKLYCLSPSGKVDSIEVGKIHEPSAFLKKYSTEEEQGKALRQFYLHGNLRGIDFICNYNSFMGALGNCNLT